MFDQITSNQFTWPITHIVPVGDKDVEVIFTATFERLEQEEIEALTSNQLIHKALKGWDERVRTEKGVPIKFEDKAGRARVLAVPGLRQSILMAYLAANSGQARRKN